jgi:hypothetical protein
MGIICLRNDRSVFMGKAVDVCRKGGGRGAFFLLTALHGSDLRHGFFLGSVFLDGY